MIRIARIGDKVSDDIGNDGIIDSISGDKVQIDRYESWTIPERCVGVRFRDGWHIVSMRLLHRA